MQAIKFKNSVFNIGNNSDFLKSAIDIFHYQARNNNVYEQYIEKLKVDVDRVKSLEQIPFLPIVFFRTHKVITGNSAVQKLFESSGTTSAETSRHYLSDISCYEKSFRKGFEHFFGKLNQYCILALLPSYLEREDSSLIYMVNDLIKRGHHPSSGFYLDNTGELAEKLIRLDQSGQKIILLGVTYALLDFVDKYKFSLKNVIVMETGGMKGRRKEMVREEVHAILCRGFGVDVIYSEYGMTELLSQAYSKGKGLFYTPPWMKVLIRDIADPFSYVKAEKPGGINTIDLASINSCSFIATQDMGRQYADGSFEVLGRLDNSDLRGCNLMIE